MGLRINELEHLLHSFGQSGIPTSALTIGRMDIFVGVPDIAALCARHGLELDLPALTAASGTRIFLDDLLRALGVGRVDSVDYSDFEGATIVHDLSLPIDGTSEAYALVYESGTLEHIFNFPTALENILSFCEIGGRVILNTPCNNQAGHGFYQFSPELFFSAFRGSEVFRMEAVEVYEDFDRSPRFSVRDPKDVKGRVEIRSFLPVNLTVVLCRLTAGIAFLPSKVLQTDYVEAWAQKKQLSVSATSEDETYSDEQKLMRELMMKLDQWTYGLVRCFIAAKRRRLYIGSKRADLVATLDMNSK